MAFSIAARTLLELGKELISSDEVAIYELIKNAIDASSPRVTIAATIVISRRSIIRALEDLEDGASISSVLDQLTAAILGSAPEPNRSEFRSAVTQAAKAEDKKVFADEVKEAYARSSWLEIADSGQGMSFDDLSNVFLRIGTNSRHKANADGALYLGDKGVGRLSTMRLGDRLSVKTATAPDLRWNHLNIDWGSLSHDKDVDLSAFEVEPTRGGPKPPGESGTTIRISALNGDWDSVRFTEIFHGKIARMIDPFTPGKANDLLEVRHNGNRVLIPSIPVELLTAAHAVCFGKLEFEPVQPPPIVGRMDEPVITGRVDYRLRQKSIPINARGGEILSLAQRSIKKRGKRGAAAVESVPIRLRALRDLGSFNFEIYWYNRRIIDEVENLTDNAVQTRTEIARWAGGPMLYRYDYRVLPYGEPGDDWLALDQNAWGESGFKLNRQQVIGRVRVTAPHTALGEQTNREGLVQSDAAEALRTILFWVVHNEMRGLINTADKAAQLTKRTAEDATLEFRKTQEKVEQTLTELRQATAPSHSRLFARVSESVSELADQCATMVRRIDKAVDEAVSEREKFVHLAGIGLMTEFIFHELNRSVEHTLGLIHSARRSDRTAALQSLDEQLQTLQKRIAAFDELAGERRQSKRKFDLREVVELVLANHANEFQRHKIEVDLSLPDAPYSVKAVRGMVIQILENLIVNATYWLKQQVKFEPNFKPKLWIVLDASLDAVTVEDNGPGVDPERREHIFEPFISSKPAGQGRGLGLFISRDMAQAQGWALYMDDTVGRHRPQRTNMFVLDMSQ